MQYFKSSTVGLKSPKSLIFGHKSISKQQKNHGFFFSFLHEFFIFSKNKLDILEYLESWSVLMS
jgi:hypothetical protein